MAQHQNCKRSSLCLTIKITNCCENIAIRAHRKMVLKASDINLLLGNYHLYWKVYAVDANLKFH